jgi:hypothetical protein
VLGARRNFDLRRRAASISCGDYPGWSMPFR